MPPKVIAHIDMDAFFAAVEQRDDPLLRGRPVVVGADPHNGRGRGVVSTCSYEARVYGIHSAQPISLAYQKCPHAVFLPVNGSKYHRVSGEIFRILHDFTPDVQPVSIDEAFLDITGSFHFYKTPLATAQTVKKMIFEKIRLTCSIGIAPNKMTAKIASDVCKPDGLLEVTPDKVLEFLWPLPVERLWGVGPKTKEAFHRLGVRTVGELARIPEEEMCERFGEHGRHLYELSHGVDERDVELDEEIKSVSHEHTFDQDCRDMAAIDDVFLHLSEKVSRRLRKNDLKGKTLTVKIRLKGFETHTRAHTFSERTNFVEDIYRPAKEIFLKFYKQGMSIRLIGVRMSNFDDPYMRDSLFADVRDEKKEKIHRTMDLIKDKFGEGAIHRGKG